MRHYLGGQTANRLLVAAALVTLTAGAASVAASPQAFAPGEPAVPTVVAPVAPVAASGPAPAVLAPPAVPSPADVVRETGRWFSHGRTLELRPDGSGTFAVWMGAFDGHLVQLRLIPAPGEATVAEVVAVDRVGEGALAHDEVPGIGGLVTVTFGPAARTAHVEWSSGPRRLAADLCATEGLDARAMEELRCGA
ncbi:hypothetical protein M3B38_15300 [Dietzia cinnamea]|uniref:hypothetical protein n=1 Tax=Dietzia cinnamea TaxID=321318 RepID=UPI0021A6A1B9|nr:hypothetical protein [Dietzia cinnamea]MCT1713315.1 hypothetical protein [Dietzia cinnamea]